MKMKSVSGITCYVENLAETIKFYEDLGFEFKVKDATYATAYLNWFWIMFIESSSEQKEGFLKDAKSEHKGEGMYLYISVEDVDEFYKGVLDKGMKPSSEPKDWPWGNREFALKDPSGYKLIFFKRK
ncbi:VOC family protein [Candidatus Dojkabacteria bacterium]|uniref:VOC family protein n=1 Tax=Candidatus Dojkabacteria bacterium TaxID=2099670 RepID=A0A955I8S1_9BACT|nr:VOC family protein [Candidatus Dojkabacteria bacterium]